MRTGKGVREINNLDLQIDPTVAADIKRWAEETRQLVREAELNQLRQIEEVAAAVRELIELIRSMPVDDIDMPF